MDNLTLALDAVWRILLAGLLIGAGLPALFALGIRSLAHGGPTGRAGGYVSFSIVLLAVALGITFIVATGSGKELSFEHIYPTLVSKD
ncbi:hypothetical protein ACTI_40360 [Actinoplanes sp. OR16]|uniref:hypothetical protein n=1 Tax=Actinoplanes sp. OR16 TaxID=946334 RepID=UPI000F6DD0D7|nr:hypothetical protein [Actinoplanes sp. OR16]BBH67351.1 hypothetical protein ACTI_40360 [Actinoplanes sp. OR16]